MIQIERSEFDFESFLARAFLKKRVMQLAPGESFFSQGGPANSVFYLQHGRAKATVVSQAGKEATIMILSAGDFVGEESLGEVLGVYSSSAKADTVCTALDIKREEVIRGMREYPQLSDQVLMFLLARNMRTQADLVDQLFNSSEKRLARTLLVMAECENPGEQAVLIPKISQETLAEMIGTTRSRVSFFMNRFRRLELIEYKDRIRVHRSRLNDILRDELIRRDQVILLDQVPNFEPQGAPDSS